jgi:hypothetical protein
MTQRKTSITLLIGAVVAIVLCGTNLMAQLGVSTIRGTATDRSGAAVPGVSISLVNVATNAKWSVKTDTNRDYEIPGLLQGTYRLTAMAHSFQAFAADNIILTTQETRRVDIPLQLGSTSTQVTGLLAFIHGCSGSLPTS